MQIEKSGRRGPPSTVWCQKVAAKPSGSFLLLLVRHLLVEAMHLFLIASYQWLSKLSKALDGFGVLIEL